MQHREFDLVGGQPRQRVLHGLGRALYVRLDDDPEFFRVAGLLLVEIFQRGAAALGQFGLAPLLLAVFGDLARLGLVAQRRERVAGLGHPGQPQNLDRHRRRGRVHLAVAAVDHGANTPVFRAADERVADLEFALLHKHRGNRPAAAVELGFDDHPARELVCVGAQLHDVGLQNEHLQQVRDAVAGHGRHGRENRLPAHVLGNQAVRHQIALDAVEVGADLVHLVDRDDDGHLGRPGVIDGLDRLRHDPVVGRHDQGDDVRSLGAARAHGRERLVAGRVEKRHAAAVDRHVVRPDVLGDAARLVIGHVGLPDLVQQRRLAVVDVAHDRHHRRPRSERAAVFDRLERVFQNRLGVEGDVLHGVLEIRGDQRCGVVVERLVDGRHDAQVHQLLDDLAGLDTQAPGQVADADDLGNPHDALAGLGHRDGRLALLLARQDAFLLRAAGDVHFAVPQFRGVRVEDDLPLLAAFASARRGCGTAGLATPRPGLRRARGRPVEPCPAPDRRRGQLVQVDTAQHSSRRRSVRRG